MCYAGSNEDKFEREVPLGQILQSPAAWGPESGNIGSDFPEPIVEPEDQKMLASEPEHGRPVKTEGNQEWADYRQKQLNKYRSDRMNEHKMKEKLEHAGSSSYGQQIQAHSQKSKDFQVP